MKTAKYFTAFPGIFLAAFLLLFSQLSYAGIAGHVQFVNGLVQIANTAKQTRILQKGDAVHESDTVITAKNASVQIRMLDGGMIAVRPDSQLKFDSFVFSGEESENDKSFFSLLRGGFRSITGLVGHKHKANYRITTAGSTIGVRGTDHETFVVVADSELAKTTPTGTYNKVNVGETVLTTDKGTINILPNQMGFAADANQVPQLQPINLNIFTAAPSPALETSRTPTGESGRAGSVVDNAIQGQDVAPGSATPQNPTLRPITADRPTAPPIKF